MKGTYVFLADGFEISEALTTVNMLRRGGVNVKTVSIYDDRIVTSSNRIPVVADMAFGEFRASTTFGPCLPTDVMIFPGGMPGSSNLAAFPKLMDIMLQHYEAGGTLAAICAAPSVVLGLLPTLEGKKMTCYDGFEEALQAKGAEYVKEGVVVDGNIITGRGPGWAVEFGLAILSLIKGQETADKVKAGLML
ncbi:MAG: DJ-1/PfpI family protein [Bacteroidales bacterium]|jgi:4-methyl-5(b-hydroxyethyl)-thiazole monophosphate biosynthesis|nr:DJ-1/PfpI family protein [Bacteroidales bacterium]MBR0322268.1 DJ-1/PfpI family protein [Bacteroidales bacterium]